jgi:hypothetical protein
MLVIVIKSNNYEYNEYYDGIFGKYVVVSDIYLFPRIVFSNIYFTYFEKIVIL